MPNKARYWRGRCNEALRRRQEDPELTGIEVYRLAFGIPALPSLWGFDLDNPRVGELLLRAVQRGRPFRHGYTVSHLCGGWRNTPPADVML